MLLWFLGSTGSISGRFSIELPRNMYISNHPFHFPPRIRPSLLFSCEIPSPCCHPRKPLHLGRQSCLAVSVSSHQVVYIWMFGLLLDAKHLCLTSDLLTDMYVSAIRSLMKTIYNTTVSRTRLRCRKPPIENYHVLYGLNINLQITITPLLAGNSSQLQRCRLNVNTYSFFVLGHGTGV